MSATTDTDRFLDQFDPEIAAFWRYWDGLPKVDFIPHLSDYLDNVPPAFQPHVAIIDVFSAERMTLRLLGTVMSDSIGADGPIRDAPDVYDPKTRAAATRLSWLAVSHPCGYVDQRPLRSAGGRVLTARGIVLPLRTDRTDCKSMVNFSAVAQSLREEGLDDRIETVTALGRPRWIDIGNGVPVAEE
jgi:hypothetical protein